MEASGGAAGLSRKEYMIQLRMWLDAQYMSKQWQSSCMYSPIWTQPPPPQPPQDSTEERTNRNERRTQRSTTTTGEFAVASLSSRILAEFLDTVLISLVKVCVMLFLRQLYGHQFFQEYLRYDIDLQELLLLSNMEEASVADAVSVFSAVYIAFELFNRVVVSLIEAAMLSYTWVASDGRTLHGFTPGKSWQQIRVLQTTQVERAADGRIRVTYKKPSFWKFFWRSLIKSLVLSLFMPAAVSVYFLEHNQMFYDRLASTVVVVCPIRERPPDDQ